MDFQTLFAVIVFINIVVMVLVHLKSSLMQFKASTAAKRVFATSTTQQLHLWSAHIAPQQFWKLEGSVWTKSARSKLSMEIRLIRVFPQVWKALFDSST
jgi:hypothetical protein